MKRIYRKIYPADAFHPDWKSLLGEDFAVWNETLSELKKEKKVLVATSIGVNTAVTPIESLLAVALTMRGAEVHVLLCDKALPACMTCAISDFIDDRELAENGPQKSRCKTCFDKAYKMYRELGVHTHLYSEFLNEDALKTADKISKEVPFEKIKDYSLDGMQIGQHALAGAVRFYARASFEREKHAEIILRRYFKAALLTTYMMSDLYSKIGFDAAVFHHGIYVPQGLVGEVSRKRGVRVINWTVAYRKKSLIFSHNDTYHHTMMTEDTKYWDNMDWSAEIENDLMNYLNSRRVGGKDWISFNRKSKERLTDISREMKIDFSKPCIGMLTNVIWDAQLHYPANAFPDMLKWLSFTINYFAKRKDLQLIIRIHPGEINGLIPSRQPVLKEIKRIFPVLPPNILIIPPQSHISTYSVMERCNAVIIYGTKTGVELTSFGIPVIVAGEAWIRNKGLTFDAASVKDYTELLDSLPLKKTMSEEGRTKARKYAFHFFFRRMIPLDCLEPVKGWPPYRINISGLAGLLPGKDKGLDVICDGILKNTPFIYPAEKTLKGRIGQ